MDRAEQPVRRTAVDSTVSYKEWSGPPGATLVCLHPIGKDASTWDNAAPLLARLARVVAPDLPGHGASARCGGASIEEQATRIAAFVREVIEGDAVLVGDSFGGAVAAIVAGAVPTAAAVFLSSYFLPFYAGSRAAAVAGGLALTRVGEAGWSLQRRVLARANGHPAHRARTTFRALAEVGHLSELDDPHWWVDTVIAWLDVTIPAVARARVSRP